MQAKNYTTIAEIITGREVEHPGSVAIEAPDRSPLSYGDLLEQVRNTVRQLNEAGIGHNDRVAIVLPNGPEMAVAAVSVAAGATCAPLNPGYQAPEFEFYLSDLNAKALLLHPDDRSAARSVAEKLGIPVLEVCPNVDGAAGQFSIRSDSLYPQVSDGFAQPDDIALVLHTSGTTSKPKIVPLTHTNLCASAANISATLQLSQDDQCLNIMPLFHIHGLLAALLSSLTSGGGVICTPGFSEDNFFRWLDDFRPSWYTAVPTMHQAILARAQTTPIVAENALRFIRSSSAALPPQVMAELEKVFTCPVIEAYGMTEAAHQMASNPLPPDQRKARSVGIAAGPEVAIMNEDGAILTAGETGEIVIRGANVTPGYENNPEANATAFTDGWFRTGDQGVFDRDGYLFITGRLKEIINRGGEKISPREIDEALLDHPDISQAVAFAVPHDSLGEDLVAAVVLRDGAALSEKAIREFLFSHLADFKVPSYVILLDAIPKGATGKVQRISLAEKLSENLRQDFAPPETDLELLIADIWMEVLRLEQVGRHDNFFALGGDSLRGTQVMVRIQAFFQVNLSIVTIFMKPTVMELAQEVSGMMDADALAEVSELLAEMKNLSEEEAQQLLEEELQNDDGKPD